MESIILNTEVSYMGMLINKVIPSGITVNGAYARISNIFGTKEIISFTLEYFVSKNVQIEGNPSFYQDSFSFKPDVQDAATNFIRQSYKYLKTLDDFKSAIDVLEVDQSA